MSHSTRLALLAICSFVSIESSDAAESPETRPDYVSDIKPLLIEKCGACHGALKQEAGLRLDAIQLTRRGSESGPVVVVGNASTSELLSRVATDDLDIRMPPEGEGEALDQEQVDLLRDWIDDGATGPTSEEVPPNPRDHWAYQRPVKVTPPADTRHVIDAFLNAAQLSAGVTPIGPADRAMLLRRVTIDLTGLPPTREELGRFASSSPTESFEQTVDRLLASAAYGERWGRHWMDVWRYSDWYGYKEAVRGSQRHIWRWRDWIIESLNDDVGYDDMIRMMLAADELAPTDFDELRATGFLARNFHNTNRNIWLDATVEHTAKAFLGITMNCARCHDHKYDPIAQADYYAMRAIFEPHNVRTERLPGEKSTKKQGLVRVYDAKPDEPTYFYFAGDEKRPDKENPVSPAIPDVLGAFSTIESVDVPRAAWLPDSRDFVRREETAAAQKRIDVAKVKLQDLVKTIPTAPRDRSDGVTTRPPPPPLPSAMSSNERVARAEHRATMADLASLIARWDADEAKHVGTATDRRDELARAAADSEREAKLRRAELEHAKKSQALQQARAIVDEAKQKKAVEKAEAELDKAQKALGDARTAAAKSDSKYTAVMKAYPKSTTGRRTAFARWITDQQNPLAARVAVNHVWLRLMGEPLVPNVFDFGLRSPRPVHADLLDWLAVDLMEHDWSLKHLVRTIVMSDAYKRASSAAMNDPAAQTIIASNKATDPDNEYFWRGNIRRLDAEVVRDSVLSISGSLDRTLGGPDIPHADGETVLRRSVYIQHAYEKQMTMLLLFDAANPSDCYRRSRSVVPQQALSLSNSGLALSESRKLARKLWKEVENTGNATDQFISLGFRSVLSRDASERERRACARFLESQQTVLANASQLTAIESKSKAATPAAEDAAMRARENLIHVLINHNDFVTLR